MNIHIQLITEMPRDDIFLFISRNCQSSKESLSLVVLSYQQYVASPTLCHSNANFNFIIIHFFRNCFLIRSIKKCIFMTKCRAGFANAYQII